MWAVHPDIARRWTKKYGSKIVPKRSRVVAAMMRGRRGRGA